MSSTSPIRRRAAVLLALGSAGLLASCAVPQVHLDDRFGEAVNQNVVAQIADPDARYTGDPAPGSNGARVAGAQERYRAGKVIAPAAANASTIGAKSASPGP